MSSTTRVFPLFTGPDRVWGTFAQGSIFLSMIICVYLHPVRRCLKVGIQVGALYTSSDLVAVWCRALGSQRKSNRKSDRKLLTLGVISSIPSSP